MTRIMKNNKGATMVEILISILILGILLTVTFFSLNSFRKAQALAASEGDMISVLEKAHENTLASINSTNYGVHFTSTQMTLFTGSTYASGTSTNVVTTFDSNVTLSGITLTGGGADVIFDRLVGTTSDYGTLVVSVAGNNSQAKTITITKTGLVSGT